MRCSICKPFLNSPKDGDSHNFYNMEIHIIFDDVMAYETDKKSNKKSLNKWVAQFCEILWKKTEVTTKHYRNIVIKLNNCTYTLVLGHFIHFLFVLESECKIFKIHALDK